MRLKLSVSSVIKIDSPGFKAWFGNSKVVTPDGHPLRVYHGTNADVKNFNPKLAAHSGIIWFTSDPETSSEYSQQRGLSGANVIPLYASIQNPAGWNDYRNLTIMELKSRGYDGAILKLRNGHIDGFVLKPSQLKSALSNNGKFNPRFSDITR
jgi:hypothetical protein